MNEMEISFIKETARCPPVAKLPRRCVAVLLPFQMYVDGLRSCRRRQAPTHFVRMSSRWTRETWFPSLNCSARNP